MGTRVRFTAGTFTTIFGGGTDNSATPQSLSGGSVATPGNLIAIGYRTEQTNIGRVPLSGTDASGLAYSHAGTYIAYGGGLLDFWYGIATANNSGQNFVFTLNGPNADNSQVLMWEFGGIAASQAGIQNNSATAEGVTSHGSGSVTPSNAIGVIIALSYRSNGDYTDDVNFTEETTGSDNFYAGYILDAPTSARALAYTSVDPEGAASKIVSFVGAATARVMRPAGTIGTGGMQRMGGGMQGRADHSARHSASPSAHLSARRSARPELRA